MGSNLPAVDLGLSATATAIAVGWSHTCALLVGGSLKCWGFNDSDRLAVCAVAPGHRSKKRLPTDLFVLDGSYP